MSKQQQVLVDESEGCAVGRTDKLDRMAEVAEILYRAIDFHDSTRGYYFWSPNGSASGRRYKEKQRNEDAQNCVVSTEDFVSLPRKYRGVIEITQSYRESCNHVYVRSYFTFDAKKTNITKIRNIHKQLEQFLGDA